MDITVACLRSRDTVIVAAALAAAADVFHIFRDSVLQYMHLGDDTTSLALQLLRCAASRSKPKSLVREAEEILRYETEEHFATASIAVFWSWPCTSPLRCCILPLFVLTWPGQRQ